MSNFSDLIEMWPYAENITEINTTELDYRFGILRTVALETLTVITQTL